MLKSTVYVLPLLGLLSVEASNASDLQSEMTIFQMREMLAVENPEVYEMDYADLDAMCVAVFGKPVQESSPVQKRISDEFETINSSIKNHMSEEDQLAAILAMEESPVLPRENTNSNIRQEQDADYQQASILDAHLKQIRDRMAQINAEREKVFTALKRFNSSAEEIITKIENLTALNARRDEKSPQYHKADLEIKCLRTELLLLNTEQARFSVLEKQLEEIKVELDKVSK